MNRGSPNRRGYAAPWTARFNEAPIHESGKYCDGIWTGLWLSCFNEAPIHESGKC